MRKRLLLAPLVLAGCAHEPPPAPQIIYRTEYVVPPEKWVLPTSVATPPPVNVYNEMPIALQLKLMTDAYNRQTQQVLSCNADKEAIVQFVLDAQRQQKKTTP